MWHWRSIVNGSMAELREEPNIDALALRAIRSWVHRNCGISFSSDQDELFAGRIKGLCRDVKLPVVAVLRKIESGDRDITLRVAEAVSTNYTFFFREPEIFNFYTRTVVPSFADAPLRVWSAAASSGDEAYSIAIASYEALGESAYSQVRILGTDISERQVRYAEAGVYPRDQTALIDAKRKERWFRSTPDGKIHVADAIKRMCMFRRLNLTQHPWPFEQRFQVIFLRNVLYYFEPAVRKRILDACYDAVEPGGYMITSLTEPMIDVSTRFQMVQPAIYRRGVR
jgi:chemotaxis protein methyltransferase CheR